MSQLSSRGKAPERTNRNEEERNMSILKNFDIEKIRKERAKKLAGGAVDLVAAINEISTDIAKLNVGETAKIAIPEGQGLRKFVMSITAKLNNLTPKGGAWAGRQFKVISDGEKFVYVQRGEDNKAPVERRRGNGGGRRKAVAPAEGAAAVAEGGEATVSAGETEVVRA
jgi:hypothetical protein